MIYPKSHYEIRIAKLLAKGEIENARLIAKAKREMRRAK